MRKQFVRACGVLWIALRCIAACYYPHSYFDSHLLSKRLEHDCGSAIKVFYGARFLFDCISPRCFPILFSAMKIDRNLPRTFSFKQPWEMENRTRNAFRSFANKYFYMRGSCSWKEKRFHSEAEIVFCRPLWLFCARSKQLNSIVFYQWKTIVRNTFQGKKSNYRLTFYHRFCLFLLDQACESSCFHRYATVLKQPCRAIFSVLNPWFGVLSNCRGCVPKRGSHWSKRLNKASTPLFVRHSMPFFCQTFSSTLVALADIKAPQLWSCRTFIKTPIACQTFDIPHL